MRIVGLPYPGSVAQLGDSIRVTKPIQNGVVPGDPIGRDIDPAGRPRVLIGGIQNLQNALLRRLRCPRGYLPHHPEYGSRLHQYIGEAMALADVLAMRDDAARTCLDDPRVISVVQMAVDADPNVVMISGQVETALGLVELSGAIPRVEA